MSNEYLSRKLKLPERNKVINTAYYISFSIFFLFALIGMLGLNTILHEYSHKRDFQSVEPYDETITINIPLSFSEFYKTNGEYSFYYDLNNSEEVEDISKFTELKAYSLSGVIVIFFSLCFLVIIFGEKLKK